MDSIEGAVSTVVNQSRIELYGYNNYYAVRTNAAANDAGGEYHVIHDKDSTTTLTVVASRYALAPNGSECHVPNGAVTRFFKSGGTWYEGTAAVTSLVLVDAAGTPMARLRINGTELHIDTFFSGAWVNKQAWD